MKIEQLLRELDAIEAEMKRLGLFSSTAQSVPKVTSAFGYGQMSFQQWLSGVFLPNARAAVQSGELPNDSQVGVAAMRNFDGDDRMNELVSLLGGFDQCVRAYARHHAATSAESQPSNPNRSGFFRRLFQRGSRDA